LFSLSDKYLEYGFSFSFQQSNLGPPDREFCPLIPVAGPTPAPIVGGDDDDDGKGGSSKKYNKMKKPKNKAGKRLAAVDAGGAVSRLNHNTGYRLLRFRGA
jgi:hypothetical protein